MEIPRLDKHAFAVGCLEDLSDEKAYWRTRTPMQRLMKVLCEFGFDQTKMPPDLFQKEGQIIRMGMLPIRIEVLTAISGGEFKDCYNVRKQEIIDDVEVSLIGLDDLKKNKKAAGRHKDLGDLENLP